MICYKDWAANTPQQFSMGTVAGAFVNAEVWSASHGARTLETSEKHTLLQP